MFSFSKILTNELLLDIKENKLMVILANINLDILSVCFLDFKTVFSKARPISGEKFLSRENSKMSANMSGIRSWLSCNIVLPSS